MRLVDHAQKVLDFLRGYSVDQRDLLQTIGIRIVPDVLLFLGFLHRKKRGAVKGGEVVGADSHLDVSEVSRGSIDAIGDGATKFVKEWVSLRVDADHCDQTIEHVEDHSPFVGDLLVHAFVELLFVDQAPNGKILGSPFPKCHTILQCFWSSRPDFIYGVMPRSVPDLKNNALKNLHLTGLSAAGEFELVRKLKRLHADAKSLEEIREWLLNGMSSIADLPTSVQHLGSLLEDPHAPGWVLQQLGERGRISSFNSHVHQESKHHDMVVPTQVFTPRWVADVLAEECFRISGPGVCLDPACGGGQMLFAWLHVLVSRGMELKEAIGLVRGVDLDPRAVEHTRLALLRLLRLEYGHASPQMVAQIERQVVHGDGLEWEVPADVVLMNPPYMGARSMPAQARQNLRRFGAFGSDLYTAFIAQGNHLAGQALGVLAPQTLWFTRRYEDARRSLLEARGLYYVAHLGSGTFPGLSGEKSSVLAFVCGPDTQAKTRFVDLRHGVGATKETLPRTEVVRDVKTFGVIPGAPLAHWLSTKEMQVFEKFKRCFEYFDIPGTQNKTGNNQRFIKAFREVDAGAIVGARGLSHGAQDGWYRFYSKGGRFSPWWGNWDVVVDFSEEAQQFYATNPTSSLVSKAHLDRPGLCYTDFGGQNFSARFMPKGCIFDMAGPAIFSRTDDEEALYALLVVLNSSVASRLLVAMNPSLHFQVGDVRSLPIPPLDTSMTRLGEALVHAYQGVYAGRKGTAESLFGPLGPPMSRAKIAELEGEAEALACRAYGLESRPRPLHSVW